jgi:hypothetical protein
VDKYAFSKKLLAEIKQSRFLKSSFSDIFLLGSFQHEVDQILKGQLPNGSNISMESLLRSFTLTGQDLDPIADFTKTALLHLYTYENHKQLDEIAMGFVYSHEVNATAFQGKHDEIAIAIDYSLSLVAERLFNIVIYFFLTEPSMYKFEKTKGLISQMIRSYILERQLPEVETPSPHEVEYVSVACAWAVTIFCLLHEIGHVLKGHFLNCHNEGDEIRIIRLQPFQETEADGFAMQEWLRYHKTSFIRNNPLFPFDEFSEKIIGFDPVTLKAPLVTFLPISIDIILTIFQLLDRFSDSKPLSHPAWQARKDHIRNCTHRGLSKRQKGVLATVEKLID